MRHSVSLQERTESCEYSLLRSIDHFIHMKWFIGFFVLLVALVTISGCTQMVPTATPATTIPTTVPTTEQVTVATPVPTTIATPVATTIVTTKATTKVTTSVPTTTQPAAVNVTKDQTVAAASGVTTIHITSTGFKPQVDIVLPGTGISWFNDDTVPHSVKSTGIHTGMFTLTDILPGTGNSYTFGAAQGTFEYALVDQPKVNGTIIVKSGSTLWTTTS
jgi:plastocyanin